MLSEMRTWGGGITKMLGYLETTSFHGMGTERKVAENLVTVFNL